MTTGLLASLPEAERKLLRKRRPPAWIPPMLATLTDLRFSDPGWVFERKVDGVRGLAFRRGSKVRLLSRNRLEMGRYAEIVEALADQPAQDFVVDGEVVAFHGRLTSFSRLQRRGLGVPTPVFFYVFDLLHLDGRDLRRLPLRRRKALLRRVLRFGGAIRFLPHRAEHGERFHREACQKGWEGIIAKRADAPYTSGRSGDWLKLKCVADQELVIGGFTDPRGSRAGFGALLVGHYDNGALAYAGKVGTGYNELLLRDLRAELDRLGRADAPFTRNIENLPRKDVHWVEPTLVAQVGFAEWTRDGRLRHPRFQGLRRDKDPREVVRERPSR
ncbi:MAG: non-homologous end-joining DNA ligase [Actinomycetota bacterium]